MRHPPVEIERIAGPQYRRCIGIRVKLKHAVKDVDKLIAVMRAESAAFLDRARHDLSPDWRKALVEQIDTQIAVQIRSRRNLATFTAPGKYPAPPSRPPPVVIRGKQFRDIDTQRHRKSGELVISQ